MNRGKCRLQLVAGGHYRWRDTMLMFKCVRPSHEHTRADRLLIDPDVLYPLLTGRIRSNDVEFPCPR